MDITPQNIVVVDPTPWATGILQQLSEFGFSVHPSPSIPHAIDNIAGVDDAWVITELRIDQYSAADMIHRIRPEKPGIQFLVVTSYASIELAVASIRAGARDVITKPATVGAILRGFDCALPLPLRAPTAFMPLKDSIRYYISNTLAECRSVSKTAKVLGVDRRSLRRMITRYAVAHSSSSALPMTEPAAADAPTHVSRPLPANCSSARGRGGCG